MNDQITDKELIEVLQKRFDEKNSALLELRELTKELQGVNNKLTQSEALKTHFISNITNEIINPFASILGIAQSLKLMKEGDWDKMMKMANLIQTEAFSLDFQLKNIFAAAELEAGNSMPNYDKVDIRPMIESVLDRFGHEAEKKGITFVFECTECGVFVTDPEKLQLVVSNLVSNAIKFSHEKGNVKILMALNNENLEITVVDVGIGISQKNLALIFDRFERLDTGINSINRGHGLGLSINKAVVDLLNGSITVESEEGKGAKFSVVLSVPPESCMIGGFTSDPNELFFDDDEIF